MSAGAASSRAPHWLQNFAPAAFTERQEGQTKLIFEGVPAVTTGIL